MDDDWAQIFGTCERCGIVNVDLRYNPKLDCTMCFSCWEETAEEKYADILARIKEGKSN